MTDQYEYKVISPSTTLFGRVKKEQTEQRLNQLAREGWELDQTPFDGWSLSFKFILRRSR